MKKLKFLTVAVLFAALGILSSCEALSTEGTVKVVNYTGSSIIVDVNDGVGDWLGEKQLSNGSSTSYTAEEGSIDGVARYVGSTTWYYSSTRTLSSGGTVTITWSPAKKSATVANDSLSADFDGVLLVSSRSSKK